MTVVSFRDRRLVRLLVAALLVLSTVSAVGAQRADTARAVAVARPIDSLRPPISARRAFLYSFLLPGYSQSVLGRHKTATGFVLFEAIAIAMIRESAADVHEARRGFADTLVVSWIDEAGRRLASPDTMTPRFRDAEVRARRAHMEDWIAVLVANHLAAGAEAYVASELWDVPARVGLRLAPRGVALTASITW